MMGRQAEPDQLYYDFRVDEGLVGGEGFAVDASLIQADANKQRSVPGSEWDPADVPPDAKQAVQDYLATLDDAAFGAASEVTPKFVSPSDPAAQWTGALRGPAFFAYATNYLVDTDNAVIVDVDATRAIRQTEVGAARLTKGRPYGTCLYVFTSTTGVLIGLASIAPDMADSKKPIRQAGEIASLLIAIVFVASDALSANIGSNSHLCDDLDRAYRTDSGAGTFRKLNFYLFDAAERGCLSLASRFVGIGADVEARNRSGNTALNIAARMGHQDLIGYLLEEGSDLEKANIAGSTPLLLAVESDRRRAVKVLLEAGADPNVANLKGIRPLIAAAFNGNDRLVKLLLEHGADPDHADRTGKSAIIYAAGKGFAGIVEQFIGAGVPADAADAHTLTPLMWAAGHANDVPADEAIATIELLLARGASIDLQDDRGRSALMIAAERGHGEVVRHLMAAGADRLQQDKNGKRALDLAADPSVRSLLEGS